MDLLPNKKASSILVQHGVLHGPSLLSGRDPEHQKPTDPNGALPISTLWWGFHNQGCLPCSSAEAPLDVRHPRVISLGNRRLQLLELRFQSAFQLSHHMLDRLCSQQRRDGVALFDFATDLQQALNQLGDM